MTTVSRLGRPPISHERAAIRSITVAINMRPGEKQRAAVLAENEGRSLSNFIRHVYLIGLAQYEAEQARTATQA